MPITAYLPTSGASFGPDAVASMTQAFDEAIVAMSVDAEDETKRGTVARFIFHLAEIDGGLDSAALRDKTIMALGDQVTASADRHDASA